jgi:hypothetical protein
MIKETKKQLGIYILKNNWKDIEASWQDHDVNK